MEIRGLIFDNDGTLVDTMPAHFLAWQRSLARHGMVLSEERFYTLGGMPPRRIVAMLAREQGVEIDVDVVAAAKIDEFLKLIDTVRPIEPVVEIARAHRGKLPMAVASGTTRPVLDRVHRQLGLRGWFDAIVTSEDTDRHKPDPDVFLEAARQIQVAPAACRVYEDSDLGIEAARRAGMQWVDVRQFHPHPRRDETFPAAAVPSRS
jgi:HAD superfamily hydrolase (TIGR01549 family)